MDVLMENLDYQVCKVRLTYVQTVDTRSFLQRGEGPGDEAKRVT